MYMIPLFVDIGLVFYSFLVWGRSMDFVPFLMNVGLVRVLCLWSRTPRSGPCCVAADVWVLNSGLSDINSARHLSPLMF
jgi:hypothetical protein